MNARLELLRRRAGKKSWGTSGVQPRKHKAFAPLSSAQHRMWLHQELHPDSSAYNVSIRIDLSGDLDEPRLIAALEDVVNRHEVLRTTYHRDQNAGVTQKIHETPLPYLERLEGLNPENLAGEVAAKPFGLARDSPIRVHLLRHHAAKRTMILTVHHIVWDGGCFGVFCADLSEAYRARATEPLKLQYADFAEYEAANKQEHQSKGEERQLDYWRRKLTPLPAALPLPTVAALSPAVGDAADRTDRNMSDACCNALGEIAQTLGATPFAVFTAAYALLLRQWSGEEDITIATMVANRHQPGAGALIGNFGNTVLLRMTIDLDQPFAALVSHVQSEIRDSIGNGEISFERLIEELQPARAAGHGFFTDTLGLFLDRDMNGPDLPDVEATWDNIFNGASPFALTFQGFLSGGQLKVEVTHRRSVFDSSTIHQMLDHLDAMLCSAQSAPYQAVGLIAAFPYGQTKDILDASAGERVTAPVLTMLDHWHACVAADPMKTAMVCEGVEYSYGHIDQLANTLAVALREKGLQAETPVGVLLRRGLAACVAPLAIWKAGGVYFPLNPDHPQDRLQTLLSRADTGYVICDTDIEADVVSPFVVVPEKIWSSQEPQKPDDTWKPDALSAAHVSFTSGSTGAPKGVITTQAALAARTGWVSQQWSSGSDEHRRARLAKSTPTAIDAIAEMCEAWMTGDMLIIATDQEAGDPMRLGQLMDQYGIRHFMAVPGLLSAVATAAPESVQKCLRVLSTGEPLLAQPITEMRKRAPGLILHNAYGCSETTGDVISGEVPETGPEQATAPIGTPLPGSLCYVLTSDLSLAPNDVLGELYVASPQLARGYLKQPGLTASRFVANPFQPGQRLYRTGDLARRRANGQLELAGRSDDQVNVRGHRVDPAETQAKLLSIDAIEEACVIARPARGTMELVAYVAGRAADLPDQAQIKIALAQTLPGPFIPAVVIAVEKLPRLMGGKIDRIALQNIKAPAVENTVGRAAIGPVETALAALLAELLERDVVGAQDNFFALGGDSMLALSFAARANAMGFTLTAASIFQFPTIAQLAEMFPAAEVSEKTDPTTKAAVVDASKREQQGFAAIVHRMRLSGLEPQNFLSWRVLETRLDTVDFESRLENLIRGHPNLGQPITMRGRLWRLRQHDKAKGGVCVVTCATSLSFPDLLDLARSHIDVAGGRGVVGINTPDNSVLVAHAAILDGSGMLSAVAEIEDRRSEIPNLPCVTKGNDVWADEIERGGQCSFWGKQAPQDVFPVLSWSVDQEIKGVTEPAQIIRGFVSALLQVSCNTSVSIDVEIPSRLPGPLSIVPVSVAAGSGFFRDTKIGTPESFQHFQRVERPSAAGPGVLLHSCGVQDALTDPPNGAEVLYKITASWQVTDEGTVTLCVRSRLGTLDAQTLLEVWVRFCLSGGALNVA